MVNEINIVIFIFLNILIFVTNTNIVNNPNKTNIETNPLDFYISFNSCIAKNYRLAGENLTIIEENEQVKFNGKSYTYSSNIFYINDTNNEFLFAGYNLYKINKDLNGDIIFGSIEKEIPNNCKYFGYMKKQNPDGQKNEIILYGINGRSIFFYFIEAEKENKYEFSFNDEINTLSCKYLNEEKYLCAFDQNEKIHIIILIKNAKNKLTKENEIIDNLYYYKVILYDIDTDIDKGNFKYKILCSAEKENYFAACKIIKFESFPQKKDRRMFGEGSGKPPEGGRNTNSSLELIDLACQTNFLKNEDNCYMTEFMSEFLLCCGMQDKIKCQRKNITFGTIDEFEINLPGNISNLTMANNNDNYVTLSYINETSTEKFVYEYYIYPPECQNISSNITPFNEKEFILFHKKTNTQYYITFNNLPFEFGISKLNGNELNNMNSKEVIEEDIANFSFISNNNNTTDNLEMLYNISIEETYSAECKI